MAERILDPAIVKDLSNHIYEKRKATAYQIEGLTKAALTENDSGTIQRIIGELTLLANSGSTTAKMGAITALGSVSVALGSLAIAFFLEPIVQPIFATFRDTDARVRYYACESLYNIAKIARGEILLYFNEVFDILCILVTDTESSVKNAADILDRLIKDIVSAKSANYVSILHQQSDDAHDMQSYVTMPDGVSLQVNNAQDPLKAFSLPRFIPTLLERMYTIEPFAKKFMLSWLELFDDVPGSELITFLPNFLEPLLRFLMNNCPSDVRLETQNLLNIFLKETKAIYRVKSDVRRRQLARERDKRDPAPDDASIRSTSTTIVRRPSAGEFVTGQDIFIDYPSIIDILISFLRPEPPADGRFNNLAGESHDVYLEIQAIALRWLQEILGISPTSFSKFLPDCVALIMQNVALADDHNDVELRNQFLAADRALRAYLMRLHEAAEDTGAGAGVGAGAGAGDDVTESELQGLNRDAYDEFVEFHLLKTFDVVMAECLSSVNELARLTSLDWLTFLYSHYRSSFFREAHSGFAGGFNLDLTALLRSSVDASNDVISKVLALSAQICMDNDDFFHDFMEKLVRFFETEGEPHAGDRDAKGPGSDRDAKGPGSDRPSGALDRGAAPSDRGVSDHRGGVGPSDHRGGVGPSDHRGGIGPSDHRGGVGPSESSRRPGPPAAAAGRMEFIVRRLCVSIGAENIFRSLSDVLTSFEDTNVAFISHVVVTLNNILLTTPELSALRKRLRSLDIAEDADWALFSTLFRSWCHNVPSALSLCLLTANYELAFSIVKDLAEREVTFSLLSQLDVLVQLLESHIFLKLRLQLLEPAQNPHLYKTLYGILMVMPQSSTYHTLRNRLSSMAAFTAGIHNLTLDPQQEAGVARDRVRELAEKYARISEKHELAATERRQREFADDSSKSATTRIAIANFAESEKAMQDYFYQPPAEKKKERF